MCCSSITTPVLYPVLFGKLNQHFFPHHDIWYKNKHTLFHKLSSEVLTQYMLFSIQYQTKIIGKQNQQHSVDISNWSNTIFFFWQWLGSVVYCCGVGPSWSLLFRATSFRFQLGQFFCNSWEIEMGQTGVIWLTLRLVLKNARFGERHIPGCSLVLLICGAQALALCTTSHPAIEGQEKGGPWKAEWKAGQWWASHIESVGLRYS